MTNKSQVDFKKQFEEYKVVTNENGTVEYFVNGQKITNPDYVLSKNFNENNENGDSQNNAVAIEKSIDTENDGTSQIYYARLTSKLRDYLHKSYDNVVFLSGAGTSMFDPDEQNKDAEAHPSAQAGPTMAKLAKYVTDKISSPEYGNHSLTELAKEYTPSFAEEMLKSGEETAYLYNHFEEYISYLESQPPIELNKITNLRETIFNLIVERVSQINSDLKAWHHSSLLNSLTRITNKNVRPSVVTTNYDSLFETQGEKVGLMVVDGFSYTRTPKFQDSNFDLHLMVEPLYDSSQQPYEKVNAFNLLKLHGSLDWKKNINTSNSDSDYDVVRVSDQESLDLNQRVMIFPSSDKYRSAFTEPYFELMSRFQALLRMRNTLLITSGFSFADMHIRRMVLKALKENEQLSVLITDLGAFDDKGAISGYFNEFSDMLNSPRLAMMGVSFSKLATYMQLATKDVYDEFED